MSSAAERKQGASRAQAERKQWDESVLVVQMAWEVVAWQLLETIKNSFRIEWLKTPEKKTS